MAKILLIDDIPNILMVMRMNLEKKGYCIATAGSGKEGLNKALHWKPDVIISDICMEDLSGMELFHILRSRGITIPFIFITAYASINGAVNAIKQGAIDYITKPIDYTRLGKSITSVLEKSKRIKSVSESHYLVGSCELMQQLYHRIRTVAATNATVLITGESGTGKELIARAIHNQSQRKTHPFVPLNCAVLSHNLLESEIFGHEKGAFTGATGLKKGLFEIADRGTLFLDEVSEIDLHVQVKLLRVLQERSFTRVGGTEPVYIDVRIIAATNRRLEDLVKSGEFRQDLFYRLNVIPISVPPLRAHLEDLPELVDHITMRVCQREGMTVPSILPGFIKRLAHNSWPGNVRELENFIERLLILYCPTCLEEKYLNNEITTSSPSQQTRHDSERSRIISVLHLCQGNKTEAAKVLGIPRRTLYNKINKLKIQQDEYSDV